MPKWSYGFWTAEAFKLKNKSPQSFREWPKDQDAQFKEQLWFQSPFAHHNSQGETA